jgi:serine/threonine-protein kinase
MAPEQARGEELDRRADLYAVGVMLWEALAGQRLWQGQNEVTILTRLVNDPLPSPRSVNPGVPDELERICMKAVARDREVRYTTAAELQADIERYLEATGQHFTARDIGKAVSVAFEKVRAETRAAIEDWLQRAARNEVGSSASLPALPAQRADGASAPRGADSSMRTLTAEVQAPAARASEGEAAPRRRIHRGLAATLLVAMVGAIVAVSAFGRRTMLPAPASSASAVAAPAPSAAPVAPIPSAPPAPASIDTAPAPPAHEGAAPREEPSIARPARSAPHGIVVRPPPPAPIPSAAPAETPPRVTHVPDARPDAGPDETRRRRLDTQDPFE